MIYAQQQPTTAIFEIYHQLRINQSSPSRSFERCRMNRQKITKQLKKMEDIDDVLNALDNEVLALVKPIVPIPLATNRSKGINGDVSNTNDVTTVIDNDSENVMMGNKVVWNETVLAPKHWIEGAVHLNPYIAMFPESTLSLECRRFGAIVYMYI